MTGKITNQKNREPLYNVNVFSSDATGKIVDPPVGTTSNFEGLYSLQFPATNFVTFSSVGFKPKTIFLYRSNGGTDQVMDIQLEPGIELPEVEIVYDNRPFLVKHKNKLLIAAAAAGLYLIFS